MKKLFALAPLSLFLFACLPVPQQTSFFKIEYEAYTRGAAEYILLENGQIKHVLNRQDTVSKPLKEIHYKKLSAFLKELNLSSLETLSIPSTRHQSDGSMAASLLISDKDQKEYVTPTFDDNNPPKEIKPLIDYLKSIAKEKE